MAHILLPKTIYKDLGFTHVRSMAWHGASLAESMVDMLNRKLGSMEYHTELNVPCFVPHTGTQECCRRPP